jgi:hypothetical protein
MAQRGELLHRSPRTASGLLQSNSEPSSDQLEHNRALIENLHFPPSSPLTKESGTSPQEIVSEKSSPLKKDEVVEADSPQGGKRGQRQTARHIT